MSNQPFQTSRVVVVHTIRARVAFEAGVFWTLGVIVAVLIPTLLVALFWLVVIVGGLVKLSGSQ